MNKNNQTKENIKVTILEETEKFVSNFVEKRIRSELSRKSMEEIKQTKITVNYDMYKEMIKKQLSDIAKKQLDIKHTEAGKSKDSRNVRETYMYRDFLDSLYAEYVKPELNEISVYQDLIMKALNELRGGCTTSLSYETDDTINKIKKFINNNLTPKNEEIKNAKSEEERKKLEKEKEELIDKFDKELEGRERSKTSIKREENRPQNEIPKNRTAENEIDRIKQEIISEKYQEEINRLNEELTKKDRVVVIEKEKIIKGPERIIEKEKIVKVPGETIIKEVQVPGETITKEVEKIVEKEKEPKIKISFDGKKGLYKLDFSKDIKEEHGFSPVSFRPRIGRNYVKKFNSVIIKNECKKRNINFNDLEYNPEKVIDINIYAMLNKYGKLHKEVGNKLKDYYIDEVIKFCKKDRNKEEKTELGIEYNLRDIKSKKSVKNIGKGLTGFIRRYRIKHYAEANGQDGIKLAKYTRAKKARRGLIRNIKSRRGTLAKKVKSKSFNTSNKKNNMRYQDDAHEII